MIYVEEYAVLRAISVLVVHSSLYFKTPINIAGELQWNWLIPNSERFYFLE